MTPARSAGRSHGGATVSRPTVTAVSDAWARVRSHLAKAGRPDEGFGAHYIMTSATSVDAVLDTTARWERAGGTHVSIYTMDQHFTTAAEHVEYLTRVRRSLGG